MPPSPPREKITPQIRNRRDYDGPAFLRQGFRPFFLGAGASSALAMALWLFDLLNNDMGRDHGAFTAFEVHMHEMLFGFLAAAITGFLLTAVPNWTGRLPVRGIPLLGLALIWLAGRLAVLFAAFLDPVLVALVDSAFLVVFAALIGREIIGGQNRRNLPVAALVSGFAITNIAFHLALLDLYTPLPTERIALAAIMVVTVLVSLIGGRITPSFTRNWMAKNKRAPLPAATDRVDTIGLALIGLAALALITASGHALTGLLCLAAALMHGYRLSRWRGLATTSEPLVFVLHLGYAWVGVGFLLAGLSALTNVVPFVAALHAFTAGAMGVMVLAVMTRATRGHSGAPLAADRGTTLIYALVNFSAIIRVGTAALDIPAFGYSLSALSWIAAFALFCMLYFRYFIARPG